MNRVLHLMVSICLINITPGVAQTKTENIIIITLDGYRWKEVFNGVDPNISVNPKYVSNSQIVKRFQANSPEASRRKLMPFLWEVIANQGQLYGNRKFKNRVNCSNIHLLSYPGYSEMFVGFPDRKIHSNELVVNPNATVLEFIHKHDGFNNKVAAFGTWNAFPYIFRKEISGFHVNSGHDLADGNISLIEKSLNIESTQHESSLPRADVVTFSYASEFLKRQRPRVLFLGFDETDQHGHGGRYDSYLEAAHRADSLIRDLWHWIQADPHFRNKTTLFITTDHGRGNGKEIWRNHRLLARGSGQIWFAVIGPDTPAFGEMKFKSKLFQKQVAKTIAAFLGLEYKPSRKVGEVIQTMVAAPRQIEYTSSSAKDDLTPEEK